MSKNKWKKISRGRCLMRHPDDFYVIVPEDDSVFVPFECPVCFLPMRTADDSVTFREIGCCEECKLRWAESRLDEWKSGWRPTRDEVDESVQARKYRIPRLSD